MEVYLRCHDQFMIHYIVWSKSHSIQCTSRMKMTRHSRSAVYIFTNSLSVKVYIQHSTGGNLFFILFIIYSTLQKTVLITYTELSSVFLHKHTIQWQATVWKFKKKATHTSTAECSIHMYACMYHRVHMHPNVTTVLTEI